MDRVNNYFNKIKCNLNFSNVNTLKKSLLKAKDYATKRNDNELTKKIKFELDLMSLSTQNSLTSKSKSSRFVSNVYFSNSMKYPNLNEFTDEHYDYYDIQLDKECNIFLRQKYADFMYEYSNKSKKNKKELSEILLKCLLYNSQKIDLDENILIYIDILSRMTQVSIKFKNHDYLKEIIQIIVRFLEKTLQEKKNMRYIYEVVNLILNIKERKLIEIENTTIERLKEVLYEFKKIAININDFEMERNTIKSIYMLSKQSKNENVVLSKKLGLQLGHSYEKESLQITGENSNFRKAYLLEQALKNYSNYGLKQDLEKVKVKIKQSYEKASKEDLKVLEFPYEVPKDLFQETIKSFNNLGIKDTLMKISEDQILKIVPDKEQLKKELEVVQEKTPVMFKLTHVGISNGNKIFEASDADRIFKLKLNQMYVAHLIFKIQSILIPFIDELKVEKGLNWSHFFEKIIQFDMVNNNKYSFIKLGIKKHFEEDYISSIHILVPHFEDIFRSIFNKLEYPTTAIKKGDTMHEVTFNSFLELDFVKDRLDTELYNLIQITMVEQTGLNLRNKIAHGLINEEECNQTNSTLVIFLYLILTNFFSVTSAD